MREKNRFIEAGRITNTHGIRGELKVEVWLDNPEALGRYPRLFIDGREIRLISSHVQKQAVIATLEGISDINAAQPLKGKTVYIAREDAQLPPGGYFLQDLYGAEVIDENGEKIGTLTEILERPASQIYVVTDRNGMEHLVPAIPEFVRGVDVDEGILTVHLIEGM